MFFTFLPLSDVFFRSFNDTTAMTSTFYQTVSEAVGEGRDRSFPLLNTPLSVSGASYMDKLAGLSYQTGGSASMKDATLQIFEFG